MHIPGTHLRNQGRRMQVPVFTTFVPTQRPINQLPHHPPSIQLGNRAEEVIKAKSSWLYQCISSVSVYQQNSYHQPFLGRVDEDPQVKLVKRLWYSFSTIIPPIQVCFAHIWEIHKLLSVKSVLFPHLDPVVGFKQSSHSWAVTVCVWHPWLAIS